MPDTLFEDTKDLEVRGERLSGDPEVLHEIADVCPFSVARVHIRRILEAVPEVFPEDWESPEGLDQLTSGQQQVFREIAEGALFVWEGSQIQQIIRLGVDFRESHS